MAAVRARKQAPFRLGVVSRYPGWLDRTAAVVACCYSVSSRGLVLDIVARMDVAPRKQMMELTAIDDFH